VLSWFTSLVFLGVDCPKRAVQEQSVKFALIPQPPFGSAQGSASPAGEGGKVPLPVGEGFREREIYP